MGKLIALCGISIHALREEGDRWATIPAQLPTHFYPRPPRGGRPVSLPLGIVLRSISIHALREEGDNLHLWQRDGRHISIHALREEGDQSCTLNLPCYERFLSTPSARRATTDARRWHTIMDISIHALREEGDAFCCRQFQHDRYFYPRPPRGGRPRKRRRTDGER